ncbi:tRNA1Val (adenine37-N6)-methyltransferase [Syntrophus gentianae]|uniref:tRNA1Val (Adenine37-N6)-methyltransferase n=1 Tax=Syntrophus gentianae TaxID=43775 RepID=A0A1H8AQT1_9BACT|nr:tRNA1(Val) (adenine(37)-N6)-methyltransferase [Syntrophus gentianae]SEM72923.1 tRNA1Val (adenine37-N6)-methyltransferase [Syntrophus gentianae]
MILQREDETVDGLLNGRLQVIQKKKGYRFSLDALLLASFLRLGRENALLDMGTGSGVLALISAVRRPDVRVVGMDIQEDMVEMATRSAALNGLEDRVKFRVGDVRQIRRLFEAESFDAVVCNPPYRKVNSGRINPLGEKALARHEIRGTLRDFLEAASYVLKPGGRLFVIYPAQRLVSLIAGMREAVLEPKRCRGVHSRSDTPGTFVLAEGVKGGGEELEVLPPLFIYKDAEDYTEAMEEIFKELSLIPSFGGG